jgi:hypothetical protein
MGLVDYPASIGAGVLREGITRMKTSVLSAAVVAVLTPGALADVTTVVRAWGWQAAGGTQVPAKLGPVAQFAAGHTEALAVLTDGSLRVWGAQFSTPEDLGVVMMADAGHRFVIALTASGQVRCFGINENGVTDVPPSLGAAVKVSAGTGHVAVLDRRGQVWSWGANNCGQVNVPADLHSVTDLDAGQCHTLAIRQDGSVSMWGFAPLIPANMTDVAMVAGGNQFSMLANTAGHLIMVGGPQAPSDLRPVTAIAAGPDHALVLQDDGTVRSWGNNNLGQATPPVDAMGAISVSAGYFFQGLIECNRNRRTLGSPELSPFSFGAPRVWTAKGIADPRAGAVVKVTARGQLGTATRFLNVRADGMLVGTIFGAGTGAGACTSSPSVALVPISAAQFATMVSDGAVEIRIEPSINATSAGCDTATLTVTLQYEGQIIDCDGNGIDDICQLESAPLVQDCNGNGLLDACEPLGDENDCDGNGVFDSCDISRGEPDEDADGRIDACELNYGDLNLDGQVNGLDLAALLAVWGITGPPYGDIDGNGQVGGTDLAFLLARWGPVP